MTPPSLLCPITDFPFMLPECVPVGPILAMSLLVPLAAGLQLARRYLRTRTGRLLGQIHTRGVVCGGADGASFTLRTAEAELLVSVKGAEIGGRALRNGTRVAVTGIDGMVAPPGERLFRQPALQPGIDAIEVRPLRWEFLGWLVPALALAGWLAFVTALLVLTS